uniref:Formylglycine-generating enzyme, required for sulfatase activity, contains SUMF1/FGE domain n=1 Tax=Candidatus Kentrum sp. LPFa TaxID=2126335 RepID=A0A450XMH2_9GAMM|nr:MAG: Formylglycine-generating enzyme, required for sulfatase activity, contains SUMF1/FGE domain [Candidatus Kentron sp. LPFa]VFK30456.1 MAG: Formylglycine-generating enzyme, required for sulfatase activity, contains SUMF1/FGE domain [Candidatus Kentron sp. LPFa]
MEKHALLIGVSQYSASDLSPLPAAVADARALRRVLRHPEMGGFIDANVTLLEDPDRQAMETAIEELFSGRGKDDLALLYFSGHGLKDDAGRLYLATESTRKHPNGELVRATAVSASAVHENMERSRARRQVVILDSCYSGAFPAEYAIKDDGSIDIPSQFLPRAAPHGANIPGGEGQAILTASTATRYAFQQTDEALSLYTRFLIQGIETGEADGNDNGFVTVGELHEYARQRVQEEQPAMQPGIYLGGGGGAIRVAGTPVGDPRERYAKEVEKSLDHRGEIAIAAHPRLNDWRERLGLDVASYDAIERDAMAARRKEFDGKCQQYGQTVREILKQGKRLADEAEKKNLTDYRQRLGLNAEDVQVIQAKLEKQVAAERERHEKSLERYAIFVRTAIGQEGASFSRETREQMAGLRETLGLSQEAVMETEAKAIQEGARREEKKAPRPKPKPEKRDTGNLLGFLGGLLGFGAGVLAIIYIGIDRGWWESEPVSAQTPTPAVSLADAGATGGSRPPTVGTRPQPPKVPAVSLANATPTTVGRVSPKGAARQDDAANPDIVSGYATLTRPTATPSPTPPPPEPARLMVRSNVSGDTVTIDGRTVGPTGPEAHELPAGEYTVRVEKEGFFPFETEITLVEGGKETIPAVLKPKPAQLVVNANISGGAVTIDGRPLGLTGLKAHELAPGEYAIRVEKAGFEPFETRVTLAAGGEKSIRAHLTTVLALEPGETFRDRLKDGSLGPKMVVIPAGKFRMGSPEDEKGRASDKGPQHRVRISKAFALGVTEVTFADYDRFAKATRRELPSDSGWGRGQRPVINVSWRDATAYAKWLSGQTGEDYRLPTEAEWEYAARARTTTRYFWGGDLEDKLACGFANGADLVAKEEHSEWTTNNCRDGFVNTAPVGSFQANAFGLFDMSGNVWEWTEDCWHDDYENAPEDGRAWGEEDGGNCAWRVLRGGSWDGEPRRLRSAYRLRVNPDYWFFDVGFRLARAL